MFFLIVRIPLFLFSLPSLLCWICFAVVRRCWGLKISTRRIDGSPRRWHCVAQSSRLPCFSSPSLICGRRMTFTRAFLYGDSFTKYPGLSCSSSIIPVWVHFCLHLFLRVLWPLFTSCDVLLILSHIFCCDSVPVTWHYTETSGVSAEPGVDIANKRPL